MSQQTPGTFSGVKGAVANGTSVLSAVGEWSVSLKAENQAVVDSSTAGGTVRVGGNTDWSGRYQANGLPAVHAGDSFAFIGSIDGTEGVSGTAIVDSVKIDWDIAGGKVVRHEVTFSANGPLAEGPAVAVDVSIAIPPSSVGTVASLAPPASSPAWTPIPQVGTITLEMKCDNKPYVDSSTGGQVCRKKGPLDWTLALSVHPDGTATDTAYGIQGLPQPKSVQGIQISAGSGAYTLNWGMFSDISDILVNRATSEVVSCTLNAAMCGVASIGGTLTRGSITDPSGTTIWPPA
jgi:hypothetical protein